MSAGFGTNRPSSGISLTSGCCSELMEVPLHGAAFKSLNHTVYNLVATAMLFKAVQVDPYMKIVGKMEDEVPAFFKRMRYPFAISKSALFAVGSPHTWPGLLAALVWLTDLLYYAEKAVSSLLGSLLWPTSP